MTVLIRYCINKITIRSLLGVLYATQIILDVDVAFLFLFLFMHLKPCYQPCESTITSAFYVKAPGSRPLGL